VQTQIDGIPCQIRVTRYSPFRSGRVGHIDRWEPDEPAEVEWEVVDDRHNLTARLTPADIVRIERELENYCD